MGAEGRAIIVACVVALCTAGAEAKTPKDGGKVAGTLFVRGAGGDLQPAVALATEVEIYVSGFVARVRVSQQYRNDTDLWLDGSYVFPLPEMAAVDRMVLQVGEHRIEGRIREKEAAKHSFEKARREGRKASLLEQGRPNLFTMSVANIGPRDFVDVQIEYQQSVDYERGGFELRFPMTFTPRYGPGDEKGGAPAEQQGGPVTGPAALPSEAGGTNPLRLRVELDAGFPIERIESPSHPIETVAFDGDVQEAWLEDVPADRDFVLRWAPKPSDGPRAAVFSEERNGEHYALLMLLPPEFETEGSWLPREAIFVIDTSGSMAGASIEQARAALHLALDHLAAGDAFNVIAFNDSARPLFRKSAHVTRESVRKAHAFVDRLAASGGTQMLPALRLALNDPIGNGRRLRQVVFITDGGIGNEPELFAAIDQELGASRLFMVGIGSAPNAYLLNRAAALGRGTATAIGSQAEVYESMEAFFRKIESPVLSDLEIHWNDEVEMWPARLPDLYAGEPVVVTARLERFVGDVRITGERGGRAFDMRLPLTPGAPERGIHKIWARHKIAHWMSQGVFGVEAQMIRKEVLAVALEHQLMSRFTSLVAIDRTPERPRGARYAASRVPSHGPAGGEFGVVLGGLPKGATPAPIFTGLGTVLLMAAAALRWAKARA